MNSIINSAKISSKKWREEQNNEATRSARLLAQESSERSQLIFKAY
jgi:hypothetical protein